MGKMLAICIPTYNRPQYLLCLLITICDQLNDNNRNRIQICVSDNASEESYDVVINYMKAQNVEFIYQKADQNYGADINFLKSVELANAEYCWLAGDDDGIVDGAIDLVLNYIDTNKRVSVFVGNRIICNKNLKPFIKDNWTGKKEDFFVDFRKEGQVIQYFNRLNSTTSLGYLSTLIIKRADWMAVASESEKFVGTIYVHVAQILLMLKDKGVMMCMHPCITLSRFGNDGFYKNLKQRIFLDYRGFLMITKIFDDSPRLVSGLKGIVRRHYNKIFLYAMAYAGKLTTEEEAVLVRLGYSSKEIKIFSKKGKAYLLGGLGVNVLKAIVFNFTWFYKTCFITIQKI
ncbi:MAG: glycosyltransferase [Lachnospiraceae bacterium]|nr:glycosyltransferase [Lachnospiraceae bacterium]